MEIPFAMALERGKTLKLADLNSGFTRPDTIALAHFEASLLVDHIVRTHGDAKLQALVKSYGQGMEGNAAIEKTVGVTLPDLQASFDKALDARFEVRFARPCARSQDRSSPPPPAPLVEGARVRSRSTWRRSVWLRRRIRATTKRNWLTGRRWPPRAIARHSSRSKRPQRSSPRQQGTTARVRSWRGWPSSSGTPRVRCRSIGRSWRRTTRPSRRPGVLRRSPRRPRRRKHCWRRMTVSWRSIHSIRSHTAASGVWRSRAISRTRRCASSRRRWRSDQPTKPPHIAIWPRPICWPIVRRRRRSKRSPRSRSRQASIARRNCCCDPSRGG